MQRNEKESGERQILIDRLDLASTQSVRIAGLADAARPWSQPSRRCPAHPAVSGQQAAERPGQRHLRVRPDRYLHGLDRTLAETFG